MLYMLDISMVNYENIYLFIRGYFFIRYFDATATFESFEKSRPALIYPTFIIYAVTTVN
jgi:hypothetical protein